MRRSACWLGVLVPAVAVAAPRAVVIAAGDCRDPDLIVSTRELVRTLAHRGSDDVLSIDAVTQQLAPAPSHSVDELKRQLDAAQMQFFSGEYVRSQQQLQAAAADVEKLPPGKDRVALMTQVNLTYGLLLKGLGKPDDADERFARVLRLQPDYRLDPDFFSPLTRRRFDRIRHQVVTGPRYHLIVRSTPEGAEVSLDGKAVGRTPLSAELPAGVYALRLSRGGALSFPRTLDLHSDQTVSVDMGFEGSVQAQRVPCVENPAGDSDRLSKAARIGDRVRADEAVVLRLDARDGGPRWMTATLLELPAGSKVREGSLKIEDPNEPTQGLDDLVTFLITGQPTGKVVAGPSARLARGAELPPAAAASANLSPEAEPNAGVVTASPQTHWRWKRPVAYGATGLGAALIATGAVMELSSASAWSQFDTYYTGGAAPSLADIPTAAALRNQAQVRQQAGSVALLSGAVALGTGLYLYFTTHPGE